ncbi:hypothetical protein [Chloroflexus sp.]|uniref:hypothetical protein n=1 Tax=Chloroflexus sp. TaxID=1904827 RepID=UPI002ACEDAD1|nr:hypothetical protein [Chloroflexus sp.]
MLIMRWTLDNKGRLTATFTRPQTLRPLAIKVSPAHHRRVQAVAPAQRVVPAKHTKEPSLGRLIWLTMKLW